MSNPLSERSTTTLGVVGAVGLVLVSLVVWAVTVANRVSEHDKVLTEHAASITQLQRDQADMMKAVTSSLSGIATDQALFKERQQNQAEVLAEIKGSLRPAGAISLQSVPSAPAPRPQRPTQGGFR